MNRIVCTAAAGLAALALTACGGHAPAAVTSPAPVAPAVATAAPSSAPVGDPTSLQLSEALECTRTITVPTDDIAGVDDAFGCVGASGDMLAAYHYLDEDKAKTFDGQKTETYRYITLGHWVFQAEPESPLLNVVRIVREGRA